MTSYIVCPDCGYKLLKAGDGSNVEIHCPKCRLKLRISIKGDEITILKIISEKE